MFVFLCHDHYSQNDAAQKHLYKKSCQNMCDLPSRRLQRGAMIPKTVHFSNLFTWPEEVQQNSSIFRRDAKKLLDILDRAFGSFFSEKYVAVSCLSAIGQCACPKRSQRPPTAKKVFAKSLIFWFREVMFLVAS